MNKLKITGPGLSDIRKETPFEVPEGYFDDFSARLNNRIHADKGSPKKREFILSWKPYMAAAILLIVALLAGNYFFGGSRGRKADRRFHAEISQVVEQELYSISEETLIEMLEISSPENPLGSGFDSEEAIDYLMNEDLNGEELLNAL